MATTAATELKVLINVLQQGDSFETITANFRSLSNLLRSLDATRLQNVGNQLRNFTNMLRDARSTTNSFINTGFEIPTKFRKPDPAPLEEERRIILTDPFIIPTQYAPPSQEPPQKTTPEKSKEKLPTEETNEFGEAAKIAATGVQRLDLAVSSLQANLRFLAGGFLAVGFVRFLKDLADNAARTEVLGTVLTVVARNAGYTAEEIFKVDKSIQALGITAASSRESLTKFLQSNLKLEYAGQLARVSQDLAVIAGWNSSDTFSRLIVNIQQLDTLGLRWMGIMVNRTEAEQKFADSLNVTREGLTQRQRQEAFLLEVLEKAKNLQGAYTEAMGDVGKQITSLERVTKEYKDALGEALLPTYLVLVQEVTLLFNNLTLLAQASNSNKTAAQQLAEAVGTVARVIRQAIEFIAEHQGVIMSLIKWYVEFRLTVLALRGIWAVWQGAFVIIDLFQKLRIAMEAVRAGTLSLSLAMDIYKAKTAAAAVETVAIATAQKAAADAASVAATGMTVLQARVAATSTAVAALTTGWTGLALVMGIPIVGTIIISAIADYQKEKAKPFAQKVIEARQRQSKIDEYELFRQWEAANPEKVAELKARPGFVERRADTLLGFRSPVTDAFDAYIKAYSEAISRGDLLERLNTLKQNVTTYENRLTEAKKGINAGEVKLLEDALADAKAELRNVELLVSQAAGVQDQLSQLTNQVIVADTALLRAQQTREAAKRAGADIDVLKPLDDAIEKAKKEAVAVRKKWDELKEARKATLPPGRAAAEEERVRANKELQEAIAFNEQYEKSKRDILGEKVSFDVEGRPQSMAFALQATAFDTQMEALRRTKLLQPTKEMSEEDIAANIKRQIRTMREAVEKMAEAAEFPLEPGKLEERIQQLLAVDASAETRRFAETARARARISVREKGQQFRAPVSAQEKEAYQIKTNADLQAARGELDILKTKNAALEAEDKAHFARGELSFTAYYTNRAARLREENQKEIAIQEQALAQARGMPAEDPNQQLAKTRAIAAAEDALAKAIAAAGAEEVRLDIERRDALRNLEDQVKDLHEANDAFYGDELSALQGVLRDLERKREALRGIGVEEIDEAKRIAAIKAGYEAADRAVQQLIANERSRIGLRQTQLDEDVRRGTATPSQALQRQNAIFAQQAGLIQAQIEERQLRLRALQIDFAEQSAKYNAELEKKGLTDAEERARETQRHMAGAQRQIDEVTNSIRDLNGELITTMGKMDSYGQQLAATFRDTLGDALAKTMRNVKDVGNAFAELGRSLAGFITDKLAFELASRVTNSIVTATSQKVKNAKGEEVVQPGTSIFEGIFGLFGFKNKPDGTVGNPLHMKGEVEITNEEFLGPVSRFAPNNLVPPAYSQLAGFGGALLNFFRGGFTRGPVRGGGGGGLPPGAVYAASGGLIQGEGTGESDSIPAMLSHHEFVMPAEQTKKFLPMLEKMRMGDFENFQYADGGLVEERLRSFRVPRLLPIAIRHGQSEIQDAGASTVKTFRDQVMRVEMDRGSLNMTMREWLEREVIRQTGRK